jgi:carbon monoxide dehydrogenase subunit G
LINEFMGVDQKINYRVTVFEPLSRFAYQGTGMGSNLVDMTFTPDPVGTQVTTHVSVQLKGLAASFAKGKIHDMAKDSLIRFVKVCEKE